VDQQIIAFIRDRFDTQDQRMDRQDIALTGIRSSVDTLASDIGQLKAAQAAEDRLRGQDAQASQERANRVSIHLYRWQIVVAVLLGLAGIAVSVLQAVS
jgi:hypothetical protein